MIHPRKIYLDYAAATPMSEEVLEAMKPYFTEKFYNAGATYLAARAVRQELNALRHEAAAAIGARPAEIIFTSGATEANNLALRGVSDKFPDSRILVSAVEHNSVLKPALELGAQLIPVTPSGLVDVQKLGSLIDGQTVLLSVMLVNNELGTIQPIHEIAQLVSAKRRRRRQSGNKLPIYLHTDAAQAANYLDLHVSRLGINLMSINGGKIYGPKGAGLLYVRAGTELEPQLAGGGQEFGKRSGTENLPAIAGLVGALKLAQTDRSQQAHRLSSMRQEFEKGLLGLNPKISINGGKQRAPHLVSATIEGQDNEVMMMKLDEAGIECAVGSACSAGSGEPSHVLRAIGLSDAQAGATLRFSLGRATTEEDLKVVLQEMAKIAESLKSSSR
jgi:cysteine desulfurase